MIRVYVRLRAMRRVRYIALRARRGVLYVNLCGDTDGIALILR